DGSKPPLPFNQIQCVDLAGERDRTDGPGWRMVLRSLDELLGDARIPVQPAAAPRTATAAKSSKPSIAVLPFGNQSGDPAQDAFANGIVEEIAAALTRFKSLRVTAKAAAQYLVEGNLRRAGERVRISVSLRAADGGRQMWSERFE